MKSILMTILYVPFLIFILLFGLISTIWMTFFIWVERFFVFLAYICHVLIDIPSHILNAIANNSEEEDVEDESNDIYGI